MRVQAGIVWLKLSCVWLFITVVAGIALGDTQCLKPISHDGKDWYSAVDLGVYAQGWKNPDAPYTRLPDKAKGVVPPAVWGLSQNSSGLFVRFRSDASNIYAAHHVKERLSMYHMTAVGASGLDLYVQDSAGIWRWAGISKPTANCYTNTVISGLSHEERSYTLYLPLYNTTTELLVGVPAGSTFTPIPPSADEQPIVYYGTSITQGCSASRPGMVYTAILGRKLDRTIINLGFSGNGRMEMEMAELLAEINASLYVLDCVPNMNQELIDERYVLFVKKLRQMRPDVPVILVNGRAFTNYWLKSNNNPPANHKACYQAVEKLLADGTALLTYVDGIEIFGSDSEGAIDGSHSTDLGMMRQAETLLPVIRKVMGLP